MTRKAVPAAAGLMTGLFASFYLGVDFGHGGAFAALAAFGVLLGLAAVALKVSFRARAALFFFSLSFGAIYCGIYTQIRLRPLEALDGTVAEIKGRVVEASHSDSQSITVSGRVNGRPAKIILYSSDLGADIGDNVDLRATVSTLENSPFFASRSVYLPDGIFLTGYRPAGTVSEENSRFFKILNAIKRYGSRVYMSVREEVPGDAGSFLAAILTGDSSGLTPTLRLKMNRAGTGHLAAVSGFHVAVASGAALLVLKYLKAGRFTRFFAAESAVLLFAVFSGLRVSAVRSVIMATILFCSTLVRRRGDLLNTVSVCAAAMTLANPYAAADSSLLMSLAGVIGAGVAAPAVIREFGIKNSALKAALVSLSACLMTAPVAALHFNEVSFASPISNLAAIPLTSLALVFGMLYAALGCRPAFLIKLGGIFAGLTVKISEAVSGLGFVYIPLGFRILPPLIIIFAAACALIYLKSKSVRKSAFSAAAFACVFFAVHAGFAAARSGKIYLDVLQSDGGSAAILRKGGECIIIDFDGGLRREAENVVERSGIRYVRAVVINDNAEAGYSSYLNLSSPPETVYLPEGTYIGGKDGAKTLPENSSLEVFGATALVSRDSVRIESGGKTAEVSCESAAGGADLNVSLLKGLAVINGSETVKGGYHGTFELGGI